ncbi:TOMM precursor leader peptide-binding protein [Rathayibacter sp. VKM Ac-2760]|uniref:TOMM precursor leader peptide-binding protein n=1 Tax=Rathayibacter sp. VKM Ac-2760 TaxID=2609253 RepID=UPI0013173772|nr:TOMM precursor leader peptide-binding protein [Rathayibacter sp. VKM Ac-2760]QHC58133.1 TOMM precursor leader peptide-binding protein [Rathayibacter sp. VKM Ac-2760]
MVLQLDPRLPLLWRSATTVQFGLDHPRALLDGVGYAEELLLDALRAGTSAGTARLIATRAGASDSRVDEVLAALRPVLVRSIDPGPPAAPRVVVEGTGSAADALRSLLRGEGCELVGDEGLPGLAVLIADFAVAPARAAHWLSSDVPHLAVVFGDEAVRIGPLVEPGTGPCLHCADRDRIDLDPDWPRLVIQVLGATASTRTPLASATVAVAAADAALRRLHAGWTGLRDGVRTYSDASGAFSELRLEPHPECACRSLRGTATAPVA